MTASTWSSWLLFRPFVVCCSRKRISSCVTIRAMYRLIDSPASPSLPYLLACCPRHPDPIQHKRRCWGKRPTRRCCFQLPGFSTGGRMTPQSSIGRTRFLQPATAAAPRRRLHDRRLARDALRAGPVPASGAAGSNPRPPSTRKREMMVINGGRFCCCLVRGARWDGLSRGGTWGRASSRREEVN